MVYVYDAKRFDAGEYAIREKTPWTRKISHL